MNVTLITAGAEGLGPQYISAMLKQHGHTVRLAFDPTLFDDKVFLNQPTLAKMLSYTDIMIGEIINERPDIIGMTVVTDIWPWAQYVAKKIKEHLDVPIVAGGNHPTLVPEKVLADKNIDMVCLGEGEYAFTELVDAMSQGKSYDHIPNIWLKKKKAILRNPLRNLIPNLDTLPFPDRSIYEPYLKTSDSYMTMSGRGCLYACSYCFNNPYKRMYQGKGYYLRRRSPENFVAELVNAKKRYHMPFIKIYDDIFSWSQNGWLEKFAKLYKKNVNLPYFCLGHPKYLSAATVKLLKNSGCEFIQIGIQSMDEQVRKDSCERYETNEEILTMLKTLDKYKLKYELDHIFGLPGDTEQSYAYAAQVYKNGSSLLKINTNILSYIPKTSIIDKSIKAKQIKKSDVRAIDEGKEGCRVGPGSERDTEKLHLYQSYLVLYKMIRLIPKNLFQIMLRTKMYRHLRYFDPAIGYIARYLSRDTIDTVYMNQELHLISWVIKKKFMNKFQKPFKKYAYV